MIPEKLRKMIALLTEKTVNRKAIWNKGSYDKQFKLSLSEGMSIVVVNWEDNFQNNIYEVIVNNSSGNAIQQYETSNETPHEDFLLLKAFHKAANDQYYKVDETMETLLNAIESQDVIGQNDEPVQFASPPDDDLPF